MSARPLSPTLEPTTRQQLFQGLGIGVVDLRCRAGVEASGCEEPNSTHSIVFVRRGVFERSHRGRTLLADSNWILFFNQAEPYRYAHPVAGGDDCTILALDTPTALAAVARCQPRDAERPQAPFRHDYAVASRHAARLHFELLAILRDEPVPLAADDLLAELTDASIRAAYEGRPPRDTSDAGVGARRRREIVEAVRLILNERLDSPPRLAELAARLDCSPFHLSRSFRRVTGLTLRGYLGRLRARLAADRLARGARDLTGLALDLGFCDHSHFTNAFRREWGVPPSRLRASAKH